jgi:hypothetical protein
MSDDDDDDHIMLKPDEPPVVARLVVEIRSDGTRTIARGALEDASLGRKVGIEAEGATPMRLAMALMRAMLQAPFVGGAFKTARGLLGGRRRDK